MKPPDSQTEMMKANFLDVANFGHQLSTGVHWFKLYTLSNKLRTDRGI